MAFVSVHVMAEVTTVGICYEWEHNSMVTEEK